MKITHAEAIALNIPFYADHVTRAMQRASTHDERVWVVRLETDNGLVGWADNHGLPSVDGLVGQNPASLINRDDIGFGAQVACLDLVGQDNGVPVHELLGVKLRDRCPISWWDIDMPPQDWVAEAEESLRRGYTTFKMKARPWRDIIAQTDAVAKVVPADYKFDVDFNGFLLNQAKAEIILQKLDENPNVGMYESPFYLHTDVDGARILRERVRKPHCRALPRPISAQRLLRWFRHRRRRDRYPAGGNARSRPEQALLAPTRRRWLDHYVCGAPRLGALACPTALYHLPRTVGGRPFARAD